MRASMLLVAVLLAGALGAVSPAIADEWAGQGAVAEAWFFGLAPLAIEAAGPRWAWLAASASYTFQYLALFALVQPVLEPFSRLMGRYVSPSRPASEDRAPGSRLA